MPGDTFSHTTTIEADLATVWSSLQHAETWAHIGPVNEVWDAEHNEDDELAAFRWSADAAGRTWQGTARTVEATRYERMSLALESPELKGTLTTELSGEDSTLITVTLEARANGMLATLFWGVVSQAIGSGLPHQVDEFAATFG